MMGENVEARRHPRFNQLEGQPQHFEPVPMMLPKLGQAILAPAEELLTAITDGTDGPQPMIIIAAKERDLPAIALAFRPTREQAARLARTLTDFAEGRAGQMFAEAQR